MKMSLAETIRDRIKTAMKEQNFVERDILRVVLSEMIALESSPPQGGKPLTAEQSAKIFRKVMVSNSETLAFMKSTDPRFDILLKENEILYQMIPKTLSQDEIREKISAIIADLKSAKSEGQAVGIAMKQLKSTNESVDGNDVKTVVLSIRTE